MWVHLVYSKIVVYRSGNPSFSLTTFVQIFDLVAKVSIPRSGATKDYYKLG